LFAGVTKAKHLIVHFRDLAFFMSLLAMEGIKKAGRTNVSFGDLNPHAFHRLYPSFERPFCGIGVQMLVIRGAKITVMLI
jgi:hypothetical protein